MNHHPTQTTTPTPSARPTILTAAQEQWLEAAQRSVLRVLARSANRFARASADDVSQEVVLALLATDGRLVAIMARYPDPVVYGRTRAMQAFIQWERAERSDRGEGALLIVEADGSIHSARTVIAGDAPLADGQGSHWDLVGGQSDGIDELIDMLDRWPVVVRFVESLDNETDRTLLRDVIGLGVQVQDVATSLGIRRETASRRLSALRARLAEFRANMEDEMSATDTSLVRT